MKSSRLITIVCLFFITLTSFAATSNAFARIDYAATHTDNINFSSIEDLVNYGKKNAVNDIEALRFYFVWVARNVQYDANELKVPERNPAKQEPETVFRNRQAICRGYSDLLTVICQKAGINCRSVAGYTNTQGTDGRDDLHAWNAIEVNHEWFLFDVTWASNYLESGGKIDDRFDGYFSQTTQKFIRKHFPFDPVWQLSEFVLPKEAFFCGDTEGVSHVKTYFGDFKNILLEESNLDWAQQGIRSFERALKFMPDENRLHEALNYYKAEKAGFQFRQSRILLEQFKDISEEDLKKWTLKDVQKMLNDAQKAATLLTQALGVYESMQTAKEDMKARDENLSTIYQNKNVSEKVIAFLESIKKELKKIPIANKY
jgi:Transglutaminase-like superfamily